MSETPKPPPTTGGWSDKFRALKAACMDTRLPRSAIVVLAALLDRFNQNHGSCWPSVARIAEDCGLADRTVQRALHDALEPFGYVVVDRNRGALNRYRPTFPSPDKGVAGGDRRVTPPPTAVSPTPDIPVAKGTTPASPEYMKESIKGTDEDESGAVIVAGSIDQERMQEIWNRGRPDIWCRWESTSRQLAGWIVEARPLRPDYFADAEGFEDLLEKMTRIPLFNGSKLKKNGETFSLSPWFLFNPDNWGRILGGEFGWPAAQNIPGGGRRNLSAANANFAGTTYEGTADESLPEGLRPPPKPSTPEGRRNTGLMLLDTSRSFGMAPAEYERKRQAIENEYLAACLTEANGCPPSRQAMAIARAGQLIEGVNLDSPPEHEVLAAIEAEKFGGVS